MAANKKKGAVGIVGLGIMGGAFAKNLASAGWRVIGYDTSTARNRDSRRAGAEIARNVADLAAQVPTIITSLPNPQALIKTARRIAAAKARRRLVVMEMSTFKIEDKERAARILRKAGHIMLDCPVSGTGSQAEVGDLVFYASGDARTIARLRPLFRAFGREVYNVGAFGNGSRMKFVANLLVAINNVASGEAMALGLKSGLPPQMIFDLVKAGAANSRVFELRGPMMVKNRYENPTMKISVWRKDMSVIGHYARKIGVKTPVFDSTKPIYARALRAGYGAKDTASVCAVLEAMAKFKRTRKRGKKRR